jgi:hypothetical protein
MFSEVGAAVQAGIRLLLERDLVRLCESKIVVRRQWHLETLPVRMTKQADCDSHRPVSASRVRQSFWSNGRTARKAVRLPRSSNLPQFRSNQLPNEVIGGTVYE